MFKTIYYGLKTTKNKNTYQYKLLTGQYLAPANPLKLLLITYITFVWGRLNRLFTKTRKNERND